MTTRRRILVASTADGHYRSEEALADQYDLLFASTLHEAQQILRENGHERLDMIICGVHFDDSQMFELLQFVRTVGHCQNLPFLVIQAKTGALPVSDSVKAAAGGLGACGFLELHELPPAKANKVLEAAVKDAFNRPVKSERMDKE